MQNQLNLGDIFIVFKNELSKFRIYNRWIRKRNQIKQTYKLF